MLHSSVAKIESAMTPLPPRPCHVLSTGALRQSKVHRDKFLLVPRQPITVVLDGVKQNYNLGAIFRLCDAFLVERLVICGTAVILRKRRLVQAAQGTQHWVPWEQRSSAIATVAAAKGSGALIVVAEQTTASIPPDRVKPAFPACLVLGSEHAGVSQEIVNLADVVVAIPMLGMANSLNVATSAAIFLYWLSLRLAEAA